MTDPRDVTLDRSELLDVLERLALLPIPVDEDDLALLGGRAFDLLEARTGTKTTIPILSHYRRNLRADGHELASAGVALLIIRGCAEFEAKASTCPALSLIRSIPPALRSRSDVN